MPPVRPRPASHSCSCACSCPCGAACSSSSLLVARKPRRPPLSRTSRRLATIWSLDSPPVELLCCRSVRERARPSASDDRPVIEASEDSHPSWNSSGKLDTTSNSAIGSGCQSWSRAHAHVAHHSSPVRSGGSTRQRMTASTSPWFHIWWLTPGGTANDSPASTTNVSSPRTTVIAPVSTVKCSVCEGWWCTGGLLLLGGYVASTSTYAPLVVAGVAVKTVRVPATGLTSSRPTAISVVVMRSPPGCDQSRLASA